MATEHQNGLTDGALEAFFDAGRADAAALPDPLFARILSDAEAEALRPGPAGLALAAAPEAVPAPVRAGRLAGILAAIGGWPIMAGMVSATVTGLWIGFVSPDALSGVVAFGSDYTVGDFMPSLSLAEGG